MPAVTRRGRGAVLLAGVVALAGAAPLGAVGLGPLRLSGIIDGPREGFYLTLLNPYDQVVAFEVRAVGFADEAPVPRVTLLPGEVVLPGHATRRILAIADGLVPGETLDFRVCAQRRTPPEGIMINARVCSKITAHRVA